MKKISIQIILLLSITLTGNAQTTRYFEFRTNCGHGNWQDTSFIAATSKQAIIDTVLANLSRPITQRKFINGPITYGNGGHNHNAAHWFSWHFKPNQWDLVDAAIEVCDGCPYTDVDSDTAYWIGNIGHYCPWSGQPIREVSNPLNIEDSNLDLGISVYPNPATNKIYLDLNHSKEAMIAIYNSLGQRMLTTTIDQLQSGVTVSAFPNGFYFLKVFDESKKGITKFIIER